MIYIAENLRALRKRCELTQEDVAQAAGVSPQSVSKWERGEAYPDIELLPVLACLLETSVDALLGMDRICDEQARRSVFAQSHALFRAGEYDRAAELLGGALRTYVNDEGMMSELAMALAMSPEGDDLRRAIALCSQLLERGRSDKICHTVRAALCFMLMKAGERERAFELARTLPHARESREEVLARLQGDLDDAALNSCIRLMAIGE